MKTNIKPAILALGFSLLLLAPQQARAYYNSSTGRWINRDPISEAGGKGLYAFSDNRMPGGVDLLGLRVLHLEFNAFIPAPPSWLPEPFPSGAMHFWFATDRRGFFRKEAETARLRTEAKIDSKLIGAKFPGTIPVSETKVRVSVEGKHDNFPAYEAVIDWTAGVYSFTSPHSGENPETILIDLATPVPFKAEKEIEAETDCCVPS